MNVFDGSESFLPQFQLDGDFELLEPSVQEPRKGVRVAKVDRVGLRGVLLRVQEVFAELLGQTTELGFTRVDAAEPKGLEGDLLWDVNKGRTSTPDVRFGTQPEPTW